MSALPIRAYNIIWNEFYRDQDLQTELTNLDSVALQNVCWEKDYLTTSRPWTQKGGDVTIPLGDTADVIPTGDGVPTFDYSTATGNLNENAGSVFTSSTPAGGGTNAMSWDDPKLIADLSTATSIDVNDLRRALALQRYQEARSRFGSRYSEYLRYLGVNPSDARLQRPEYLGGGVTRLNFSEVLQTSPTTSGGSTGVGDLYGHGIAGFRGNRYRKFFEEHGYVISLMSVRPKSTYVESLPRMWQRTTKEDYWQRELEHIGQQEVYKNEVYMNTTDGTDVFGYNDRYSEYRWQPSQVVGDFRDTLNTWHLGRITDSNVALNSDFVKCSPSRRIYQVDTTQHLWIMCNHHLVARRMVSKNAGGKIL